MKAWILRSTLALAAVVALAVVLLPQMDTPEAGGPIQLYLDLVPTTKPSGEGSQFLVGPGLPPNCSTWHELYPNYCTPLHQSGYADNDNSGTITPCDGIQLGGVPYHITWVGPTYYVTCSDTPGGPPLREAAFEPTNPNPTGNPICEIWHEVWPQFCNEIHIDSWIDDNNSGVLDECDIVDVENDPTLPGATAYYHIDRIGCNIIVEPGPTPTEPSTWGKIKGLFRRG